MTFRIIAIAMLLGSQVHAQTRLMVDRYPSHSSRHEILIATEVPDSFAQNTALRFEMLDFAFDGGSKGAHFKREDGSRFTLFFPNPLYWSVEAKREAKQPVAIESNGLVEIAQGSPLQTRLLQLLAEDIVDGERSRDATLTLVRIRDCLLHRKPLDEIIDMYDPATWKRRPSRDAFGGDPFADSKGGEDDEP